VPNHSNPCSPSCFLNICFNIIHLLCLGLQNTGCFKKSFTNFKAYGNLYRGYTQRFELSKCSKTHRILPRTVIRKCLDLFFRFLLHGTSTVTVHRPGKRVFRYSRTSPKYLTTLKAYREHTQRFELSKFSKRHRIYLG
jgi:hypothetical protein